MSTIEIISGSLLLLACIFIIITVSLQSGKSDGLSGAIMGNTDGAVRGRGKDSDAKLASITKVLAVVLFVVTLGVNIIALASK